MPRIHNNWDNIPRLPWNCPVETREIYKRFLHERYKLTPYIYSYAIEASKTGEPILRPLVYHHQDDPNTYNINDEFYMGEWLLIAPVTKANHSSRKVYLPQGIWFHLWTNKKYQGPKWVEIETPMYDISGLPVFAKAGAIIPRQKFNKTLNNCIPNELILDIYPDGKSNLKLNEAEKLVNNFDCIQSQKHLKLQLENNSKMRRSYTINIKTPRKYTSMEYNFGNKDLDNTEVRFDCNSNKLQIQMPPDSCCKVKLSI